MPNERPRTTTAPASMTRPAGSRYSSNRTEGIDALRTVENDEEEQR